MLLIKKIIQLFLIFVFLFQPFNQLGIWIFFKYNQDYIAKVLCINREVPLSTCHGKCQLTKQLDNSNEKQEKAIIKYNQKEIALYHQIGNPLIEIRFSSREYFELNENIIPTEYFQKIDHPPRTI